MTNKQEWKKPEVREMLYVLPEKGGEDPIHFEQISAAEIPSDILYVLEAMREGYLSGDPSAALDTFFLVQHHNITTYVGACSIETGWATVVDVVDGNRAGRGVLEPDRGYYVPRWTSTEKPFGRSGLGTRRLMIMNAYCRHFLDTPLTSSEEIGSFAPEAWKVLERAGYVKEIEKFDQNGNHRYQFV